MSATTSPARPATPAADKEVLLTRTYDAPRERVFRAWTDREQLERWYAPAGCTIRFVHFDARPGGTFHSGLTTPTGYVCWCTGEYREVVEPDRLVFTFRRSDETGNTVEPADTGMDPDWPRETVVTVTFDDLGGRTRLTLHQTVSEALAKKTGAHPSWLQMFDNLARELAEG